MAVANPTRVHLVERLEKLIGEYNAGAIDVERLFEELQGFVRDMTEEEHRAAKEGLTEEELAIYDLLTTPEPKLSKAEEQAVKLIAKQLLERLREVVMSVDWLRTQETRGTVKSQIKVTLNGLPEAPYPDGLWNAKVEQVREFVTQRYS